MALNWNIIRPEHAKKACELVASGERPRAPAKGIFVMHEGQWLPAKQVQRIAYLLAKKMDLDSNVRFASGEGTINLFKRLGLRVERGPQATETE